jgi:hypothetical protein
MFIAENLTKHRYDLIKRLNTLRKTGKIHSYWTHDVSVLVKKTEQSRTINIKNRKHVYARVLYEDSSNKTSEDNDEYELFAEVFKRVY